MRILAQQKCNIFKWFLLILFLALFSVPEVSKAQVASDLLKEYLFPISYGENFAQNDIIGLRIYQNPDNKDPMTWYLNNVSNPKNTLPEIKADGYVAVRDDRTVYIQASNVSLSAVSPRTINNFYTNIYVLAYNQNASEQTRNIFNQMLANIKFNKNIMDIYCLKAQAEAIKDSLRRDTVRKADLYKLNRLFSSASGLNLSAGTYVPNMSISTWPSWQATLGRQLGAVLPVDPLNIMADRLIACTANDQCTSGQCSGGYCSACPTGYDPRTCWDERNLKYYRVDGFVYKYQTGVLTIRYEFPQLLFPSSAGCYLGCNLGGQYFNLGSCLADNRYCSADGWISNTCSDGIVRCNEVCEEANCEPGCLSCEEHYHAEGSLCVEDTVPQTVLSQSLSTAEEVRWTGSGWSAPYATACKSNAILTGIGSCICKTGYHEESGECVLNTRWQVCPEKPENTIWNTVSSYRQDWDGQKWIPVSTNIAIYSEVPTERDCHYVCDVDYSWTGNNCVSTIGDQCTKPLAASSQLIWRDSAYYCTAVTCVENAFLNGDECLCNSGYIYNSVDNKCYAEIGDSCSLDLAEEAVQWWQETQYNCTALSCVNNASLDDGNCVCKPGFASNTEGTACESDLTQEINIGLKTSVDCDPKPNFSLWNGSNEYIQTWDGTAWLPVKTNTYDSSATGECYFKCEEGLIWDGSQCRLPMCTGPFPTANATMCDGDNTGLTADLAWTIVSSPWDGIDNDCTSARKCEYRCNAGYYKSGNNCVPIAIANFGFVYKFVAQWTTAWPADDNFDLIIRNPAGAIAYDGSTKDDIKSGLSGYGYNYRNEVVVISKTYNTFGTGINPGTYKIFINENESQKAKLYYCNNVLRLDVYAFDGATRIMSIPCTQLGTTGKVDNWWILDVSMPYGRITVPGSAP